MHKKKNTVIYHETAEKYCDIHFWSYRPGLHFHSKYFILIVNVLCKKSNRPLIKMVQAYYEHGIVLEFNHSTL